jgi:MYXO-CTERM domain-containing protein
VSARRLAAAAAAAALAVPAAGFVRSADERTGVPLSWPIPVVPYHVSSAPHSPSPSCAPGAAGDPGLDAVRAGFDAWRQACSSFEPVYGGRVDEARIGLTGTHENLVVFRQGWCRQRVPPGDPCLEVPESCSAVYNCFDDVSDLDRSIVALTSVLYEPATGRIVDADIELNGWDGEKQGSPITLGQAPPAHGWYFTCNDRANLLDCTTYGQEGCYFIDLQATMAHEVGHFLGLAHVCEPPHCTQAHAPITMYPLTRPGDVEKRELHPDDVEGVCAIYPAGDGGGCGCGSAGAPGAIGALLALVGLWPRRRARGPTATLAGTSRVRRG